MLLPVHLLRGRSSSCSFTGLLWESCTSNSKYLFTLCLPRYIRIHPCLLRLCILTRRGTYNVATIVKAHFKNREHHGVRSFRGFKRSVQFDGEIEFSGAIVTQLQTNWLDLGHVELSLLSRACRSLVMCDMQQHHSMDRLGPKESYHI
jgi:hypothetical protein